MNKIKGGCACGAVRFTAHNPPHNVANCHCQSCRKATGAAFATYADFKRDSVTFTGNIGIHKSSPGVERLFCKFCGTPLAYRGEGSLDEINIHISALDSSDDLLPSDQCHEAEALPWVREILV